MLSSKIVSVEQMKSLEAAADAAGVTYANMMERAGQAVAEAILARVEDAAEQKVVILAGSGNNGGDGLVAAHYLAQAGASVAVYLAAPPDDADSKVQRLREKGILLADAENDQRWRVLRNLMGGVTVLVDALLGTGARAPVTGKQADVLKQAAKYLADKTDGAVLRVAVDCPSGLDCDTGAADALTLRADLTVTVGAAKRGHFQFPGANLVGELLVADIGLDAAGRAQVDAVNLSLASHASARAVLAPRPRDAHKGTFGRAVVVAGSINYTGAAYLSAAAAYRVGAGLVSLAVPAPIYPVLAAQLPEATWIMLPHEMGVLSGAGADMLSKEYGEAQALLLGPGLGQEKETAKFVRRWLGIDEAIGARRGQLGFVAHAAADALEVPAQMPPLVVDADGLKLLAEIDGWAARLPAGSVLTPHPGEMAILTGLGRDAVQADRVGMAQRFAAKWGHVVVLKGAFTIVAAPDGRTTLIPFATAALATAGTGDVLAGAIVGLLAQGLAPFDAAAAGAYLHGLAGVMAADLLGGTTGVVAGDVLDGLVEALAAVGAP